MGKIKENKFRFHAKGKTFNTESSTKPFSNAESESKSAGFALSPFCGSSDGNLFAGIDINFESIAKSLGKSDTCSLSGKSHRELKKDEQNLPKKEKIKRRHERFIQKLEVMYEAKKKTLKKKLNSTKNKKNSSALDEMAPLLVPAVDSDVEEAKPKKKTLKPVIDRRCMKAKKRKKADQKDYKHFSKVLNDPVFKSNPVQTISLYLKQKIAEKRPDLELVNDMIDHKKE